MCEATLTISVRPGHPTWGNRHLINGEWVNETHIEIHGLVLKTLEGQEDLRPYSQPWQDDDDWVEAVIVESYNLACYIRKDVVEPLLQEQGFRLIDRRDGEWDHSWWMAVK